MTKKLPGASADIVMIDLYQRPDGLWRWRASCAFDPDSFFINRDGSTVTLAEALEAATAATLEAKATADADRETCLS